MVHGNVDPMYCHADLVYNCVDRNSDIYDNVPPMKTSPPRNRHFKFLLGGSEHKQKWIQLVLRFCKNEVPKYLRAIKKHVQLNQGDNLYKMF